MSTQRTSISFRSKPSGSSRKDNITKIPNSIKSLPNCCCPNVISQIKTVNLIILFLSNPNLTTSTTLLAYIWEVIKKGTFITRLRIQTKKTLSSATWLPIKHTPSSEIMETRRFCFWRLISLVCCYKMKAYFQNAKNEIWCRRCLQLCSIWFQTYGLKTPIKRQEFYLITSVCKETSHINSTSTLPAILKIFWKLLRLVIKLSSKFLTRSCSSKVLWKNRTCMIKNIQFWKGTRMDQRF